MISYIAALIVLLAYIVFLHVRYDRKIRDYMMKLKEEDQHLLQMEKMASLGMLAAGVAHEVNNPLMFLNTNLSLVSDYVGMAGITDKEQEREILDTVEECADGVSRIKRIVQDLLSFSHPSQGKIQFVDINELLDATMRILWNEIKYKVDIVRQYELSSQIWIDPNKISQVFLNLIINAVHAIKDRGTITITTRERDGGITVIISDSGCGISRDKLKKIFDPFYTSKGGTGLGLYVSKNIVEGAEGTISVESKEDEGTTFTIDLPKGKPPDGILFADETGDLPAGGEKEENLEK